MYLKRDVVLVPEVGAIEISPTGHTVRHDLGVSGMAFHRFVLTARPNPNLKVRLLRLRPLAVLPWLRPDAPVAHPCSSFGLDFSSCRARYLRAASRLLRVCSVLWQGGHSHR